MRETREFNFFQKGVGSIVTTVEPTPLFKGVSVLFKSLKNGCRFGKTDTI